MCKNAVADYALFSARDGTCKCVTNFYDSDFAEFPGAKFLVAPRDLRKDCASSGYEEVVGPCPEGREVFFAYIYFELGKVTMLFTPFRNPTVCTAAAAAPAPN